MHRAALADEGAPACGEHIVYAYEHVPPALDVLAIVAVMPGVLLEANRRWNLYRHRPDTRWQPHVVERRHDVAVEVRHRTRNERHGTAHAVRRLDHQLMIEEVERHRERSILVCE